MASTADHDLPSLPRGEARLGALFARPQLLAAACVVALTALGWLALGALYAQTSVLAAMCRPLAATLSDTSGFVLVASMWAAMTLAMMLPSAAPMILTYAEIADNAARKAERIVSPFTLAGGYAMVWLGFAAFATIAQFAFSRAALLDGNMVSASDLMKSSSMP